MADNIEVSGTPEEIEVTPKTEVVESTQPKVKDFEPGSHPSSEIVSPAEVARKTKDLVYNKESKKFEKFPAKKESTVAPASTSTEVKVDDPWEKRYKDLQSSFTKTAQENAAVKKQLADLAKAQKQLEDNLTKSLKKPVDLSKLKTPEDIQKWADNHQKDVEKSFQEKVFKSQVDSRAKETRLGIKARELDKVNYPEWERVYPAIQKMVLSLDKRIDFEADSEDVLDNMYKLALEEPSTSTPTSTAPAVKTYTAEELEAAKKAAEEAAYKKAANDIKVQENASTVTGRAGGKRGSSTEVDTSKMSRKELKEYLTKTGFGPKN